MRNSRVSEASTAASGRSVLCGIARRLRSFPAFAVDGKRRRLEELTKRDYNPTGVVGTLDASSSPDVNTPTSNRIKCLRSGRASGVGVKFVLIDRISELDRGKRIVAHKAVSLAEEYLADHFPAFPVLPGVFLLEAMTQASAWLARVSLDFDPSVIVLKDARNVLYKSFVAPGQLLTVASECKEMTAQQSVFQAAGSVDGREIVKGKLTLRHMRLADSDATLAETDATIRKRMRELFGLMRIGRPSGTATAS